MNKEIEIKYITPKRIIKCSKTSNSDLLLNETAPQPFVGCNNNCVIDKGGSILLDFGRELCGGIKITTGEGFSENAKLRVVFGESVMEALSDTGHKNATNNHAIRDDIHTVATLSSFRVGETGFRFVKIEAVNEKISLIGVLAVSEIMDIKVAGTFECSDTVLNDIWTTAVRTVHLCMQEYLWDGIKRDRLIWVGDMYPEIRTICCAFGHNEVVEKSLDFVMNNTQSGNWMNWIASYSMWWLIIQKDWFLYSGNISYLTKNREYIFELVSMILGEIDDEGGVDFERSDNADFNKYFIDWETAECEDLKYGFIAILVMALDAAKTLCETLGNDILSAECEKKRDLLHVNKDKVHNQQIAALLALSGKMDIKEVNSAYLSDNTAEKMSAFLGAFTLLAKAEAGDIGGALEAAKSYYGRMLELGATTFWESFDLVSAKNARRIDEILESGEMDIHGDCGRYCYEGFRKSLCHGWSSGAAPFLSQYILGISPLKPGFSRVCIKPRLSFLSWAKGTFPTPFGDIEIEIRKKDGKDVITKLNVPKGIEVEL